MLTILRISPLLFLFVLSNGLHAFEDFIQTAQIDSLIKEKTINKDMTQLELLVLYENALVEKTKDSIIIFKKLAILNAYLEQPKDAFIYSEKYISNSLDFSILNDGAYEYIKQSGEYIRLKDKYLLKVNFLSFLFFYVALIGFFFAFIIYFSKKTTVYSNVFISSFVAVHSIFILEFVLYISNLQFELPHTFLMASISALSYGPLLFFYFKSVDKKFKFKIKDLLHFLPNVVLVIYLLPMYLLSGSDKIRIMLNLDGAYEINRYIIFLSKVLSLSIYAYFIGKQEYTSNIMKVDLNGENDKIKKWKKNIYRIHIAYVISYVIYGITISGVLMDVSVFLSYAQIVAMSIMVLYICYMAYAQPDIFSNKHISLKERLFSQKYKKSGLTDALSKELKENLIKLLVEDKIYRQSDINLEILSYKLNTTRHNTSQIINEHFKMNFFELINKFRIEEAQRLLKDDVHGNLNIIDIAYEVGYNNKVTFNKAFKKETSLTPSSFIHKAINNNSLG